MVTLDDIKKLHEQLKTKAENNEQNENSGKYIKFEQGQNHIRILPGKEEELKFYAKAALHKFQDAEGNWKSYQCRKTINESCPICDLYFDLWKKHKALNLPKEKDGKNARSKYGNLATQLKAKVRYYINVLDRRAIEAKDENPVKIMVAAEKLFTDLVGDIVSDDYRDENDNGPLSLTSGNDFIIELSKNDGGFQEFKSKVRPKKGPAGAKAEIARWMDQLHDFETFTKIGDYDEGKVIAQNLLAALEEPVKKAEEEKGNAESTTEEYLNKLKG